MVNDQIILSPTIRVFTKPGCPHCSRAKTELARLDLEFAELDVTSSSSVQYSVLYHSGRATVPQVFFGDRHIGGADELAALSDSGRLPYMLKTSTEGMRNWDVGLQDLTWGSEDISLHEAISPVKTSETDDEELWPVLRFYKTFFGFWPNCVDYMAPWPDTFKLFLYCHNVAAIRAAQTILGAPLMSALSFATSDSHGCNYCQVHSASVGGENSIEAVKLLKLAREGIIPEYGPIGVFESALADIASAASLGVVPPDLIAKAETLFEQQPGPEASFDRKLNALGLIVGSFGYQNVFNDLTNVEIEGDWMNVARQAGVQAGRHAASTVNPDNLTDPIPEGGPSMAEVEEKYRRQIGDVLQYADDHLGLMPNWIEAHEPDQRPLELRQYTGLMRPRSEGHLAPDLKHLMARVSAIAKGHSYLAAFEAFQAYQAAGQSKATLTRIRSCYGEAVSWDETSEVFSVAEKAALKLAWVSAQTPLVTLRRFVDPVLQHFRDADLVELVAACAVASMLQRWCAVFPSTIEPEIEAFLNSQNLETDIVRLRYPNGEPGLAIAAAQTP